MEQFQREIRLIGQENFEKLQKAKIVIFGVGGVGSFAATALARCGIQNFLIVDKDVIDITNINRQAIAWLDTIDKDKVEIIKRDILNINCNAKVEIKKEFLTKDNVEQFLPCDADFIVDCIDNITTKIFLAKACYEKNIPVISCMGAGNRLTANFKIVDIYKTYNDPVSKIMRNKLKELGVKKHMVVWSEDLPIKPVDGARTPASISFVPSSAGLKMAEHVVNTIIR